MVKADASQLKNRGLAYAITSSPYIITAFAAPNVSDQFYYQVTWRWQYGILAIIFPIVAAPLFFMLKFNLREAQRKDIWSKRKAIETCFRAYGTGPRNLIVSIKPPSYGFPHALIPSSH